MNTDELLVKLEALAIGDLSDEADIYDHPCSVAIRAITQCLTDIKTLQDRLHGTVTPANSSKGMNYLCNTNYDPLKVGW